MVRDQTNKEGEVETITNICFTRKTNKCSINVEHKSAIADHANRHNCMIDGGSESGG